MDVWRCRVLLALALLPVAGCSTDDWFFRPRDASVALVDAVAIVDAAPIDISNESDVVTDHAQTDAGITDAEGPGDDIRTIEDAVVAEDVRIVDDAVTAEDQHTVDSGQPASDLPAIEDIPSTVDASLMNDVPLASDRPSVSGPRLVSGGFMTGSLPSNSGTLRLHHAGFEFGQRLCSGSLCISGGFLR